jgi:hypothetical protein
MKTMLKWTAVILGGLVALIVIGALLNPSKPIKNEVTNQDKELEIYRTYQTALQEQGNPRSMTITPIADSSEPYNPESIGANSWEMKQADRVVKYYNLGSREKLYDIAKRVGIKR